MSLKRAPKVRLIDKSVLAIQDTGASRERPEAWFRSEAHLAWIRTLPCACGCGKPAPSQAAHIRIGSDGAAGTKPSDAFTVPLAEFCHARQHNMPEQTFWQQSNVQWPAMFAIKQYALRSPDPKCVTAAGLWLETGKCVP